MNITEQLLHSPGFIYQIGNSYYYLGKWICKECKDMDAADCHVMYEMCQDAGEESEIALYLNKIRAYSDFALEIPYNPAQIKTSMETLISSLSDAEIKKLELQFSQFASNLEKWGM